MANQVIGSAWVRIRALTTGIEDDIKRSLGRDNTMMKSLGKTLAEGLGEAFSDEMQRVKREVKRDITELIDSINNSGPGNALINADVRVDDDALENLNQEIDRAIRPVKDKVVEINVDVDDSALTALERRLQALRDREVEVDVDVNDRPLQETLDSHRDRDVFVNVRTRNVGGGGNNVDNDQTIRVRTELDRDSLEHVNNQLNDFRDKQNDNEIELRPSIAQASLRWVQAQFALLQRPREVEFAPVVDSKAYAAVAATLAALSGGRMLADTVKNLKDMFKELDKNIPKMSLITEAVGGIAAWGTAAVSNILGIAGGFVEMSGAALALPGIIAGMAVGLATTVIALKDFNEVIPGFKTAMDDLAAGVSTNFWERAEEPMRRFVNDFLPTFSSGMQTTASHIGDFFGNLADSLTGILGPALSTMFGYLNDSIDIFSGHTDSIATIFKVLGTTGAQYLPQLAQWAGDIADRFADWLEVSKSSGLLDTWIQVGITRLNQLGGIVKYTGKILWELIDAANQAGGSGFAQLEDTLRKVADVVGREPFKSTMVQIFTRAHDAMTLIATEAGPAVETMFINLSDRLGEVFLLVGNAVGDLLEGVATTLGNQTFVQGIVDLFDGIRIAIAGMEGMWDPLGEGLGTIASLIGDLAANFGPLLADLFIILADTVVRLEPLIVTLSDSLSTMLGEVLTNAAPLIALLADAFVKLLSPLAESPVLLGAVVAALVAFKTIAAIDKLRGQIEDLGVAFLEMGGSLKGAGIAGLILAAAAAIYELNQQTSNAGVGAASVDEMAVSIEKLGTQVGSVLEMNTAFEGSASGWQDFNDTARATAGAIKGLHPALILMEDGLSLLTNGGAAATEVRSLGDALGYIGQWDDAGIADKIFKTGEAFGGLGRHAPALNQSKEALENFDAAAAQIVRSGNAEQIAELEKYIAEQIANSGMSYDDAMAKLDDYALAQEEAAISMQRMEEATDLAAVEIIKYVDALETMGGLSPSMLGHINEASKAFINMSDGVDAINQGLDNGGISLEEYIDNLESSVQSQIEWADNMAILGGRASDALMKELADMGPQGAELVAELVNSSGDELSRLEEVVRMKGQGAVGAAESEFGKMSLAAAEALSKIDLMEIDKTGKLAQTFRELGFSVNEGFVTGLQEANLPGSVSNALNGLDLSTIDSTGRLKSVMQELGFSFNGDVVAGFQQGAEGMRTALVEGFASNIPTVLPEALIAQINNMGVSIPQHIVDGVNAGDPAFIQSLNDLLSPSQLAVLPPATQQQLEFLGKAFPDGIALGLTNNDAVILAAMDKALNSAGEVTISPSVAAELDSLGYELPKNVAIGAEDADGDDIIATAIQNAIDAAGGKLDATGTKELARVAGGDVIAGFTAGLETGPIITAAGTVSTEFLTAFSNEMGINSPSTVMITKGQETVAGFVQGLGADSSGVVGAATTIAQWFLNSFSGESGIASGVVAAGAGFVGNIISGITGRGGDASRSGSDTAGRVRTGFQGVDATPDGIALGNSAIAGIRSRLSEATGTGSTIAGGAKTGLGSKDASPEGSQLAAGFARGVSGMIDVARMGSQAVAVAAVSAMAGVEGGPGASKIISGFVGAIAAGIGSAQGAARSVGNGAVAALNVNGAYGSGQSIGQQFANGINSKVGAVRAAANNLAAAARGALPRSPAEFGPFSGSGWGGWGEAVADEFARGLGSGAAEVASASTAMAAAAVPAVPELEIQALAYRSIESAADAAGVSGTDVAAVIGQNADAYGVLANAAVMVNVALAEQVAHLNSQAAAFDRVAAATRSSNLALAESVRSLNALGAAQRREGVASNSTAVSGVANGGGAPVGSSGTINIYIQASMSDLAAVKDAQELVEKYSTWSRR